MNQGDTGLELPPLAPSLMQSLRSLGYSVEAALADLLDNSVAAGALQTNMAPHGIRQAEIPETFVDRFLVANERGYVQCVFAQPGRW